MKNFLILLQLVYFCCCQYVYKKIDSEINKEEKNLSAFLNKSEGELKVIMGKPDEIYFKDNSPNRFYKL